MPSKILVVHLCSNFRSSKEKTLQLMATTIIANIWETEGEMANLQSTKFTL